MPLSDATVHHAGQHVAVVVARHMATYVTPVQNHNPAEPQPDGTERDRRGLRWRPTDRLRRDAVDRRHAGGDRRHDAPAARQRAGHLPCVGGAFGCKGFIWPHTMLAVMAAKVARVPVKLVLTRAQTFVGCWHRPLTSQAMSIGSTADGEITAIAHATRMPGSRVGQFVEPCAMGSTRTTYDVSNLRWRHTLVPLDLAEGTFMQAPGETPGSFALESAIDELAPSLSSTRSNCG